MRFPFPPEDILGDTTANDVMMLMIRMIEAVDDDEYHEDD